VPWRAASVRPPLLRRRESRPQLKRDPLGSAMNPIHTQAPLFLASLVLAGHSSELRQQSCLHYGPSAVALEGTLIRRAYPGPPNYASVRQGDQPDTALILSIPKPICVAPDSSSDEGDKQLESGVRELQLAIGTDSLRAQLRAVHGPRVRVTGELFHAISGHHRTRVLIWVIQIRAA